MDISEIRTKNAAWKEAHKNAPAERERLIRINQAKRLKKKGYSNVQIAKELGIHESTVRTILNPKEA